MADTRPDKLLVERPGPEGLDRPQAFQAVRVGNVVFGGPDPVIIAGPCAVESRRQTLTVARRVREAGARVLRGGAWKPRTSPYDFQGLGQEGLEILAEARAETGLPIVTEVLDPRLVDTVAETADMLQVGSRSMQNVPLLREVGRSGKPVLLKRAFSATLDEWLCAAEYVVLEGNRNVVLCERGIRTFASGDYSRNTLDVNVVSVMRQRTWLPVAVDPSHAVGEAEHVPPAARAALAAGAHALLVEVVESDDAREGLRCDARQGVTPEVLGEIVRFARAAAPRASAAAGS